MGISKVERLMNLVIALLSTRGYLTAERIRANVAGYGECPTDEAFSRMFERDKAELRDLGIPLETGKVSNFDPTEGYRITRDDYALPDIDLTRDEAAAVAVATKLWESPERITAAQSALLKLRAAGVDVDPAAGVSTDDRPSAHIPPAPRSTPTAAAAASETIRCVREDERRSSNRTTGAGGCSSIDPLVPDRSGPAIDPYEPSPRPKSNSALMRSHTVTGACIIE